MTTIQGLPKDLGSPLGVLVAAASLYLPLVTLSFPKCPLSPREAMVAPLPWGSLSLSIPSVQQPCPLPSITAGPERADCANEDWALPSCPPPGWAPHACLATSCANVAPPSPGGGAASTNRLEDSTARPFAPLPAPVYCPVPICLSVCLYSSRRDILPHIKPQFCPLRPPPEPVFFVVTTLCQPCSLTGSQWWGWEPVGEQGGVQADAPPAPRGL